MKKQPEIGAVMSHVAAFLSEHETKYTDVENRLYPWEEHIGLEVRFNGKQWEVKFDERFGSGKVVIHAELVVAIKAAFQQQLTEWLEVDITSESDVSWKNGMKFIRGMMRRYLRTWPKG